MVVATAAPVVTIIATRDGLSATADGGLSAQFPYSGPWADSDSRVRFIMADVNAVCDWAERHFPDADFDAAAWATLILSPDLAKAVGESAEFRDYVRGCPDAEAVLTAPDNPNREYGLTPFVYGFRTVVR